MSKGEWITVGLWAVFLLPIPVCGLVAFFSQPWETIWPALVLVFWLGCGVAAWARS